MKHYKILYIKLIIIASFISLTSCTRDIDDKIKDCYNSNDTIINLSDLYPEEWDTVYYIYSTPDADKDITKKMGHLAKKIHWDNCERLVIVNKPEKIVYYKESLPNYGQKIEGAIFCFPNNNSHCISIPRSKAIFHIKKRDENSFWVVYQEK